MRKNKSLELIAFGRALHKIRKEKNLTQDQLSVYSGVDRSYISELENGVKSASFLTILALTSALKISPVDFMMEYQREMDS
ncbi:MAG: helix-turn-helix domain-containing protein [Gorillibacterium sp.]|nr:helix-turn-helix domain-containing protein [Gorillibacterium sp.]